VLRHHDVPPDQPLECSVKCTDLAARFDMLDDGRRAGLTGTPTLNRAVAELIGGHQRVRVRVLSVDVRPTLRQIDWRLCLIVQSENVAHACTASQPRSATPACVSASMPFCPTANSVVPVLGDLPAVPSGLMKRILP